MNGIRGKGGTATADTGADLHDGLCSSSFNFLAVAATS